MRVFQNESRAIRAAAERMSQLSLNFTVREAEEAIREWIRELETAGSTSISEGGFTMTYYKMDVPEESEFCLYLNVADFNSYLGTQYVYEDNLDLEWDDSVPEQDRVDRPEL